MDPRENRAKDATVAIIDQAKPEIELYIEELAGTLGPDELKRQRTFFDTATDCIARGDFAGAVQALSESCIAAGKITEVADYLLAKHEQRNVDYWSSPDVAAAYHEAANKDDESLSFLLMMLKEKLPLFSKDDIVFDLGAGTGLNSEAIVSLLPSGVRIFGTDISKAMHENNRFKDRYTAFEIGNLADGLPKSFEQVRPKLVNCMGVLHFLEPSGLINAFSDIAKVLDEEGVFVMTIGNRLPICNWDNFIDIVQSDGKLLGKRSPGNPPMNYYEKQYIEQLLTAHGFEIEEWKDLLLSQSQEGTEKQQPSAFIVCKKRKQ